MGTIVRDIRPSLPQTTQNRLHPPNYFHTPTHHDFTHDNKHFTTTLPRQQTNTNDNRQFTISSTISSRPQLHCSLGPIEPSPTTDPHSTTCVERNNPPGPAVNTKVAHYPPPTTNPPTPNRHHHHRPTQTTQHRSSKNASSHDDDDQLDTPQPMHGTRRSHHYMAFAHASRTSCAAR